MYKTTFLFLMIIAFQVACKDSKKVANIQNPQELQLQTVIRNILDQNPEALGIMVHVESPENGLSWSGAVGHSNKNKEELISPDQPFWIASNTKTYVSAAILCLFEQKKIDLELPIEKYLSKKTRKSFEKDGYDTGKITVKHLLSHTSGIYDYTQAEKFFQIAQKKPEFKWTREKQLSLALEKGEPLWEAGEGFSYSDSNYLLLTEIMEQVTKLDFYAAMRSVLDYEKLGLYDTWFLSLEKNHKSDKALVTQYFSEMGLDTEIMDPSFDLFGGGGIAATTKDLALFNHALHNGQVFRSDNTLKMMKIEVPTSKDEINNYGLGLSNWDIKGNTVYGHGGFWATTVAHMEENNTTVSVLILDRDKATLRKDVLEGVFDVLLK